MEQYKLSEAKSAILVTKVVCVFFIIVGLGQLFCIDVVPQNGKAVVPMWERIFLAINFLCSGVFFFIQSHRLLKKLPDMPYEVFDLSYNKNVSSIILIWSGVSIFIVGLNDKDIVVGSLAAACAMAIFLGVGFFLLCRHDINKINNRDK
jgi:hypothetical protein